MFGELFSDSNIIVKIKGENNGKRRRKKRGKITE